MYILCLLMTNRDIEARLPSSHRHHPSIAMIMILGTLSCHDHLQFFSRMVYYLMFDDHRSRNYDSYHHHS